MNSENDMRRRVTLVGDFECHLTVEEGNKWAECVRTTAEYHTLRCVEVCRQALRLSLVDVNDGDTLGIVQSLVSEELAARQALYRMAAAWYAKLRKADEVQAPLPSNSDLVEAECLLAAIDNASNDLYGLRKRGIQEERAEDEQPPGYAKLEEAERVLVIAQRLAKIRRTHKARAGDKAEGGAP